MANNITLPPSVVGISGYVWLQDIGEQDFVGSEFAGTRGQSRRLEGFLLNMDPVTGADGTPAYLTYRAWIQNVGWTPWVRQGQYVGTKGESLRLEGFTIDLNNPPPQTPMQLTLGLQYMAHQQDHGDIGPAVGGQFLGSQGQSLRIEGMAVTVLRVGELQ